MPEDTWDKPRQVRIDDLLWDSAGKACRKLGIKGGRATVMREGLEAAVARAADDYVAPEQITPQQRRSAERNLRYLLDAAKGTSCITCGHVAHNELGYCQVGQCGCEDGSTVASTASIVLRDLGWL